MARPNTTEEDQDLDLAPVDRFLARVARRAHELRRRRASGKGTRRAERRLSRAIDTATATGLTLAEPHVQARLRQHMESYFIAESLPDYSPAETAIPKGAR